MPGARVLRVGHDRSFSPFASVVAGRSTGLLVDAMAEALRGLGWDVAMVPVGFTEAEDDLEAGRLDLMLGLAATPARRVRFALSTPLVTTGAALFRLSGADADPARAGALATPRGGPLAAALAERFPGREIRLTPDYDAALEAVMAGGAVAAALNLHAGWECVQRVHPGRFARPAAPFLPLDLTVAARREDPLGLVAALDPLILDLRRQGRLDVWTRNTIRRG